MTSLFSQHDIKIRRLIVPLLFGGKYFRLKYDLVIHLYFNSPLSPPLTMAYFCEICLNIYLNMLTCFVNFALHVVIHFSFRSFLVQHFHSAIISARPNLDLVIKYIYFCFKFQRNSLIFFE